MTNSETQREEFLARLARDTGKSITNYLMKEIEQKILRGELDFNEETQEVVEVRPEKKEFIMLVDDGYKEEFDNAIRKLRAAEDPEQGMREIVDKDQAAKDMLKKIGIDLDAGTQTFATIEDFRDEYRYPRCSNCQFMALSTIYRGAESNPIKVGVVTTCGNHKSEKHNRKVKNTSTKCMYHKPYVKLEEEQK